MPACLIVYQVSSSSARATVTGRHQATSCRMCGGPDVRPAGTVAGYSFVACARCAFTFSPEINAKHLNRLYSDGFHGAEEGAPDEGWAMKEPEFLDVALGRLDGGPLEILDFGTGQSRTPERLRNAGHRVIAIDVAPPVRLDPDRLVGDLLEARLPGERFDLTYAFQVFEHLPEPRPYLDELLRVTKREGLLLIHTDMEMPERELGFERWWYVLPPDHCAFYRHRTFERYLSGTPHAIVYRDPKRILIQRL